MDRAQVGPGIGLEAALRLAERAARAGGDVIRSRGRDIGSVREKSASVDVVTDVDIASGVEVVRTIVAEIPEARFIVEESEVFDQTEAPLAEDASSGEVWMVDPLDGTTSFFHGYPCYSCSVALLVDGTPVVGAVYDAANDQLFSAAENGGAMREGQAVRCTDVGEMPRALLVTGFPYDRGEPLRRQLPILGKMIETAHDLRRDGSAAIDCCHVAMGRCDGYWELGLKPWDIAAGVLIAAEAGAVVTDFDGQRWTPAADTIVAANPNLHPTLLRLIAEAGGA